MTTTPTISTVGHSNRSFEQFARLLIDHGIEHVVDARTRPRSRFPWFNATALDKGLRSVGIAYTQRGSNIGGKGGNVDFDATLDAIVTLGATVPVAILCSEGDYKQCHRFTMLTPPLLQRGAQVRHIRWGGLAPVYQDPDQESAPEHPTIQKLPLF